MDIVTDSILVASAVTLTVGAVSFRVWLNKRSQWAVLAFAVACASSAVYAWFEIAMAGTDSPAVYGMLLRWSHPVAWVFCASISVFPFLHLEAGRKWLLWLIIGSRAVGTLLNFAFPVNINFWEITAIGHVTVLGESLSYAIGVPNPWVLIQYVSFVGLIAFSQDIAVTVWRRGERRKALVYGAGFALFVTTTCVMAVAVVWGGVGMPVIVSPWILFVVVAFSFELNYDLRQSTHLALELAKSQAAISDDAESLRLSAAAADLGLWKRSLSDESFTATDKWLELFGFGPDTAVKYQDYLAMIHVDDRERIETALREVAEGGGEYATEYRITLPNGEERWISSIGKVQFLNGKPHILRGVSVDITKRKIAEEAVHDLSRRLMGAQEKERARLARELHDDLSQSLALLSIQLQSLSGESVKPNAIKKQVGELTGQIQRLSSDVHRISHELHPSKLTQLGLEAALRGFCREVGAARGLKVRFESNGVPRDLPNEISLCLYRIAQESLQNAVKHSGAAFANVIVEAADGEIRLTVSDNGCGFDPESVKSKESLGLISMQERIRAVNGTLVIDSVPDAGTKVEAIAPMQ